MTTIASAGVPRPPQLVDSSSGVLATDSSNVNFDSTYDISTPVQLAIAPRADMPGPWYITNFGPSTVYLGPTGVTSGNGTAVGSGSKSAAISAGNAFTTFIVCAPGNQSLFHVTNSLLL